MRERAYWFWRSRSTLVVWTLILVASWLVLLTVVCDDKRGVEAVWCATRELLKGLLPPDPLYLPR